MTFKPLFFRGALALILMAVLLTGCKKGPDPQPATPTNTAQLTDTREKAYQVALDMYLWYQNLPTMAAFNPKSYETPEAVLQKVRTYSPMNSKGTGNLDRWSFAITKDDWNKVTGGSAKGFGFSRAYTAADTNDLRVVYTYPNSPIGQAGVQRGWRILKFNNVDATNKQAFLDAVSGNDTGTFQFITNAGETKTVTLTKAAYTQNAVLKRTVLDVDGQKVGYLMYNSFNLTSAQQELDDAFAFLKQSNVTELVVDMRYNGGGSVAVAERFANYLAPASEAGKLMYTDQHNDKFKSWNRTKNFDATLPANNLGLKRVVFLASGGTASASELLINVLKPHMDVKIIGDATYGKPVGFYGIEAENYLVFAVGVKQTNSAGYGDYYEGLPADRKQIDDITHDFGDPNEAGMKDALTYFRTGSIPARMAARRAAMDVQTRQDEGESFIGAIQKAPGQR